MVNFTLPSTSSEMISISISQTFRTWVVIFHLRRPMACLFLTLYDTPGLAPRMNVLFWGPSYFPVSYSNRDNLWNAWNRHSGSFMVDTGILFGNMKLLSRMLNDILTLDQQWLPNIHRIMSGFHGAFSTGVASQQGTLTLPDTWFRSRFWDFLVLQLLRPDSSNLPCLYSTFHLEYHLVLSRFCF